MLLYTPEGDYTLELISGTVEDGNYEFVAFDLPQELEYVEGFRSCSTFRSDVPIEDGDRLVSLCTCSYETENVRYMVIGRLVPVMMQR